MRCTLNKKAVVEFLFSKLAFLIFGIIITGAFFYFLNVQKDIQNFDETVKSVESITNAAGTVYASPFDMSLIYQTNKNGEISSQDNKINLNIKDRLVSYPFYFQVSNSSAFDSKCINITKTSNKVVLSECH